MNTADIEKTLKRNLGVVVVVEIKFKDVES